MDRMSYCRLAGVVFGLIALVHLVRAVAGWDVSVGAWDIPMWASWVAVVVAGYLGYSGYKAGR